MDGIPISFYLKKYQKKKDWFGLLNLVLRIIRVSTEVRFSFGSLLVLISPEIYTEKSLLCNDSLPDNGAS